ncbi:hypothetical protein M8C21_000452 [Ambrosia artemisiifolia]|uniref:Uncharacterized protein n=1 Tax=Ambrosia artemisiifolia TaxID=4212 RepID=A0AAD5GVB0_AMBAR|nr:hypothetical protein M8C21_000452 [Ambrosia artemisiifolia]
MEHKRVAAVFFIMLISTMTQISALRLPKTFPAGFVARLEIKGNPNPFKGPGPKPPNTYQDSPVPPAIYENSKASETLFDHTPPNPNTRYPESPPRSN